MMIVCQTAAEELEALTLSVLLLYSTQEFIPAEQREDDRPITQTTHRCCGSLVSLCHSVYSCVHLYLCFITRAAALSRIVLLCPLKYYGEKKKNYYRGQNRTLIKYKSK
jgi:hypothetical protein